MERGFAFYRRLFTAKPLLVSHSVNNLQAEIFLKYVLLFRYSKNVPDFTESKGSLQCSQNFNTRQHPDSRKYPNGCLF